MVALKGKAIETALKKRNSEFFAFLVYGPDQGLVRERSTVLAKQVTDDFSDPFSFMELSEADLKTEPSRLSDESVALSLTGGERVIRLRLSGEGAAGAVTSFLGDLDKEHLKPNGIVIIEGSDLGPRSSLRKAFEKAKKAATLPCYIDQPVAIRSLAQSMAEEYGIKFNDDALAFTVQILGEDRGISKSELEKLMLYKTPGKGYKTPEKPITITLQDVQLCLVDSSADTMDAITGFCADGLPGPLSKELHRSAMAGASTIGILRALQRQFSRLTQARSLMDKGMSPNDAMKKMRPPVFFGEQDAFRQRLNIWSTHKLKLAKRHLTDAELDAKTTGAPQREIVERTALRLARMVRR